MAFSDLFLYVYRWRFILPLSKETSGLLNIFYVMKVQMLLFTVCLQWRLQIPFELIIEQCYFFYVSLKLIILISYSSSLSYLFVILLVVCISYTDFENLVAWLFFAPSGTMRYCNWARVFKASEYVLVITVYNRYLMFLLFFDRFRVSLAFLNIVQCF